MRFLRKLYANVFGYFWLPCPICGEMFGGFESSNYSIKEEVEFDGLGFPVSGHGTIVCSNPACAVEATKRNYEKFGTSW